MQPVLRGTAASGTTVFKCSGWRSGLGGLSCEPRAAVLGVLPMLLVLLLMKLALLRMLLVFMLMLLVVYSTWVKQ